MEKVFTAFEREKTSTDSGVDGTGLGLAITKSIVDLMGGTIEVHTSPGNGTEIVIRVQFQLARESDIPKEETADKDHAMKHTVDFSQKRLLLVEDNLINMEIAGMILAQLGFTVETAENGQIAVDMVSASNVAMTANAFAEDVQAAKDAGMQAHIAKPVDIAVLTRTLQEILSNKTD